MKYLLIIFSFLLFSCTKEVVVNNNVANKQKEVILALWDSLTAWYWVQESENYPFKLQKILNDNWYNYLVINAWVSWDTSQNVLSRSSLYLEKNPKIVLLVIWWNDWLRWISTDELKKNIISIINTFPKSKIVLWWMDIPANLWIDYRKKFRDIYKEIANENKNIYFLEYFLEDVSWNQKLNIEDHIHPNSLWYDIVVKNLYDFLVNNKIISKK